MKKEIHPRLNQGFRLSTRYVSGVAPWFLRFCFRLSCFSFFFVFKNSCRSRTMAARYLVKHDYVAAGDGELSISKNEIVRVLEFDDETGWWKAQNERGFVGYAPR